jgi:hypothetical protein
MESVIISSVSLDPESQVSRNPDGSYLIRMRCDLDSYSRDRIKPILDEHKLAMKEENGYVIIYSLSKFAIISLLN